MIPEDAIEERCCALLTEAGLDSELGPDVFERALKSVVRAWDTGFRAGARDMQGRAIRRCERERDAMRLLAKNDVDAEVNVQLAELADDLSASIAALPAVGR